MLLLLISAAFLFAMEYSSYRLCPQNSDILARSFADIGQSSGLVIVQGRIVDAKKFDSSNLADSTKLSTYSGYDLTCIFPIWLTLFLSNSVYTNRYFGLIDSDIAEKWTNTPGLGNPLAPNTPLKIWKCPNPLKQDDSNARCFYQIGELGVKDILNNAAIGYQVYERSRLLSDCAAKCVIVRSKVYNMTRYFDVAFDLRMNQFRASTSFLPLVVAMCLHQNIGGDASSCIEGYFQNGAQLLMPVKSVIDGSNTGKGLLPPKIGPAKSVSMEDIIGILDSLFFIGITSETALDLTPCQKVNPVLFGLAAVIFIVRIFGILSSLVYDAGPGWRYYKKVRPEKKFDPNCENSLASIDLDKNSSLNHPTVASKRRESSIVDGPSEANPDHISNAPIAITVSVGSTMPLNLYVVPIYNENVELVRANIESIKKTDYAKDRELLVVICDGAIEDKLSQDSRSSPAKVARKLLIDILKYRDSEVPLDPSSGNPSYMYTSIGEGYKKYNFARVYSGFCPDSELPYIVIVKRENRGKRDSLWLMMNYLNKVRRLKSFISGSSSTTARNSIMSGQTTASAGIVRNQSPFTGLENELHQTITRKLGITPDEVKYFTVLDGDTTIAPEAIGRIIRLLEDPLHRNQTAACHGAILPSNRLSSLATAFQVYHWHIFHRLYLSTDMALFRSVSPSHWPGAFAVYRISFFDDRPCLTHDDVILWFGRAARMSTMHERFLVLLGEDRYLPYVLMRVHWKRKVRFIYHSGAVAWSQLCTTFATFFQQFRRWHNVKLHLLIETVWGAHLKNQFAIKFYAFFEIFAFVFHPAVCIYVYYLIFKLLRMFAGFTDPLYAWYSQPSLSSISTSGLPQLRAGATGDHGEPILLQIRHPLLQSVPMALMLIFSLPVLHSLVFILKLEIAKIFFLWLFVIFMAPFYMIVLPLYSFFTMDRVLWSETYIPPKSKQEKKKSKPRRIARPHGAYSAFSEDTKKPAIVDLSEFAVTEVHPSMVRGPNGGIVPSFEITFSRANSMRSNRSQTGTVRQSTFEANPMPNLPLEHRMTSISISHQQSIATIKNININQKTEDTPPIEVDVQEEEFTSPETKNDSLVADMDVSFAAISLKRLSQRKDFERLLRLKKRDESSRTNSMAYSNDTPNLSPQCENLSPPSTNNLDLSDVEGLTTRLNELSRSKANSSVEPSECGNSSESSARSSRIGIGEGSQRKYKLNKFLRNKSDSESSAKLQGQIFRNSLFKFPSTLVDQPRIVSGVPSDYAPSFSSDSLLSSFDSSCASQPGSLRNITNEHFESKKLLVAMAEKNKLKSPAITEKDMPMLAITDDEISNEDIYEEIYLFLEEGLTGKGKTWSEITRREVRDHLCLAFGEGIVKKFAGYIENCMDEFILDKLALL
ncbi:hypothetical protein HK098_007576 [Nowakowskiella sp. JEL0407]|nr:hypothetical protein HK098_007576 [Nowakowskiella sp. JEL0407]